MKISVEELKQKYSNPTIGDNSNRPGYCVGGALVLWIGARPQPRRMFPGVGLLSEVLVKANSKLLPVDARRFAIYIIEKNDAGLFNQAWDKLAEALEFVSQS